MKPSIVFAAALIAGFGLHAAAQTSAAKAPAGPEKIAVINFQAAVAQTNDFQRQFADLQKKFTPKKDALTAQSKEIDSLKKDLQEKAATLSDAEKASRARAIDDKQKQLQRDAQDDQSDFQQEMQQEFSTVASKVGDTLITYAKEHGYTLVLDAGEQGSPVLYASEPTNITKAVIDAYNLKSGIPAPPPAAPTPAASKSAAPKK
ncbi:MAG: OmpH family outer membrane protein [Acidobacteriota bacterium]|nr:OmpH family outer membrane protein [Acidobacteriota bacterium]